MPRDAIDELFGCDELSCHLGEDELGGVFDFLGKAVKTVAKGVKAIGKPLVSVAGHIPVVGGFVKAGATALSAVDKVTGLTKGSTKKSTGKKMSVSSIVKKAKASIPAEAKAAVAAKKKASVAAAAPVPMADEPAQAPRVIAVQPYGYQQPSTSELAAKLQAKFGADLQQITDQVRMMTLQNQATSEHRGRMKEQAFRTGLVSELRRIASNTRR